MWLWFKKPMFLKHGTINVHHKRHKMEPVAPAKKLCEIQKEAHGSCCTSIKLNNFKIFVQQINCVKAHLIQVLKMLVEF